MPQMVLHISVPVVSHINESLTMKKQCTIMFCALTTSSLLVTFFLKNRQRCSSSLDLDLSREREPSSFYTQNHKKSSIFHPV